MVQQSQDFNYAFDRLKPDDQALINWELERTGQIKTGCHDYMMGLRESMATLILSSRKRKKQLQADYNYDKKYGTCSHSTYDATTPYGCLSQRLKHMVDWEVESIRGEQGILYDDLSEFMNANRHNTAQTVKAAQTSHHTADDAYVAQLEREFERHLKAKEKIRKLSPERILVLKDNTPEQFEMEVRGLLESKGFGNVTVAPLPHTNRYKLTWQPRTGIPTNLFPLIAAERTDNAIRALGGEIVNIYTGIPENTAHNQRY